MRLSGFNNMLNYGSDKLRFTGVVPVGCSIRSRSRIKENKHYGQGYQDGNGTAYSRGRSGRTAGGDLRADFYLYVIFKRCRLKRASSITLSIERPDRQVIP